MQCVTAIVSNETVFLRMPGQQSTHDVLSCCFLHHFTESFVMFEAESVLTQVGRPRKYDLPADAGSSGAEGSCAPRKGGRAKFASKAEALTRRRGCSIVTFSPQPFEGMHVESRAQLPAPFEASNCTS